MAALETRRAAPTIATSATSKGISHVLLVPSAASESAPPDPPDPPPDPPVTVPSESPTHSSDISVDDNDSPPVDAADTSDPVVSCFPFS